jgi:hypothetical protein
MERLVYLWSGLFLFCFVSCDKPLSDVDDYYPKVTTISATVRADGSVLVQGKLEDHGAAPVECIGFSRDVKSAHPVEAGQVFLFYKTDTFSVVLREFEPGKPYFFQSWAKNEFGYRRGNIISLPSAVPQSVNVPCNLPPGRLVHSAFPDTIYLNPVKDEVELMNISSLYITSDQLNFRSNIKFGPYLNTGIWTFYQNFYPLPGQALGDYFFDNKLGNFLSGGKIYIQRLPNNEFDITICDAPCTWNNQNHTMSMRFILKAW